MGKEHSEDTVRNSASAMSRAEIGRVIGSRLRELRQNRQLSVVQLAERVGVRRQTVYSWESGHSWPGLDDWQKISSALDLRLATVFARLFAGV